MAWVLDHRLLDVVTGCAPRRLGALTAAVIACGAGAAHGAAPHPSATRGAPALVPAVATTRLTAGAEAATVGGAPLRGSTPPAGIRASAARPARAPAPQGEGPTRHGAGLPAAGPLEADAYGLNIDPLSTCVSCTSAHAGRNSAGAEGREVRLAGESVCEGQVPAGGYANGTLVSLPENSLVRLAIAEWDGYTSANREASRSHARGAFLDLLLGEGRIAAVTIAESRSDASYTESGSHARSSNDGARVGLLGGRLDLVVLHSEGSSDAPGHASLASLDHEEVMPSDRAGEDRPITVPRVTSVGLLHSDASGGLVASASDGRAQRVAGVGTTWVGSPSADPQPLR